MADEIDILSLGTQELWNLYKKQADIDDVEFNKVRKGVNLQFDIIDFFQGFGIKTKEKRGIITIRGKAYLKEQIDTELIKREKIMSDYLLEKMAKKPIARLRGGDQ